MSFRKSTSVVLSGVSSALLIVTSIYNSMLPVTTTTTTFIEVLLYVPGTALSDLHTLFQLILTMTL